MPWTGEHQQLRDNGLAPYLCGDHQVGPTVLDANSIKRSIEDLYPRILDSLCELVSHSFAGFECSKLLDIRGPFGICQKSTGEYSGARSKPRRMTSVSCLAIDVLWRRTLRCCMDPGLVEHP